MIKLTRQTIIKITLVTIVVIVAVVGLICGPVFGLRQSNKKSTVYKRVSIEACIQEENDDEENELDCSKLAINASVYLNYQFYGKTDEKGKIELDNSSENDAVIHIIDRANGFGFSDTINFSNQEKFQFYLTSDYEEPLFTNFGGLQDISFLPIDYDWSKLKIFFYMLNGSVQSKQQFHAIRDISVSSSQDPDKEYSIADCFLYAVYQRELSVGNVTKLKNTIKYLPLDGAIQFKMYIDLKIEDSIYYQISVFNVYLTQFTVNGKILAPENLTNVVLNDVLFEINSATNEQINFNVTIDSNGVFNEIKLPKGSYLLNANKIINNINYAAEGYLLLESSVTISFKLLSPNEVANRVESLKVNETRKPFEIRSNFNTDFRSTVKVMTEFQETYNVRLESSPQSTKEEIKEIQVKNGIKKADLKYQITMFGYPGYVSLPPEYNDKWSIKLYNKNSGKVYFKIKRDINSMRSTKPKWLSNGQTQVIKESIDLSAETKRTDIALILQLTASDTGAYHSNYGVHPITVNTTIDLYNEYIVSVKLNTVPANVISIPDIGKSNTFQRYADVKYQIDKDSSISLVQLFMNSYKIIEGKVGVDGISQFDPTTLRIRITFNKANNLIDPRNKFESFQLKAVLKTSKDNTLEDYSESIVALWRAPFSDDTSKRFARLKPDKGGDDWASVNMCNWLTSNTNLWTRYNDISGEHGKNIGHKTHKDGNAVDVFHYYTLNSESGGSNFNELLNIVSKLYLNPKLTSNVPKISDWISSHRSSFDDLQQNNQVSLFYTHQGISQNGLPSNWLMTLLNIGALDKKIYLNLSYWSTPKKLNWRSDHHDHVHIKIT